MRRNRTTKEDQFSSTMPDHGRIPTHGGRGSKAHHRYIQHQLPRPPGGAPMAPRSSADMMSAEASLPSASTGDGGSTSSIISWVVKPGCMMELARLAKVPQPESGLMCPRCQSTETKFCYYNNYSLSQPRHLCRTCRRYWTHGGALRDLPFSSSSRRRRGKSWSNNNKLASLSKVASCASASSSSSSTVPRGGVAVATASIMEKVPSLVPVDASRRWFPGHSSQDPIHLGYRHQLANSRAAATAIRLDHQHRAEAGGGEAGSFARQMQAISCRVPGSAAVLTTELASVMMEGENPPILSVTETMGTLASSPSPVNLNLKGESSSELFHFLGSGSWACVYGFTAGNGGSVGGSTCTVAAPGNLWPDTSSGFTSSSCGRSTIL